METFGTVAAAFGLFSGANDLANVGGSAAHLAKRAAQARAILDQHRTDVANHIDLQRELHNIADPPAVVTTLLHRMDEFQQQVDGLYQRRGALCAPLEILSRCEDLNRSLGAIERAQSSLHTAALLQLVGQVQVSKQQTPISGVPLARQVEEPPQEIAELQREVRTLQRQNAEVGAAQKTALLLIQGIQQQIRALEVSSQHVLQSLSTRTIEHLEVRPHFEWKTHEQDSNVAMTLLRGSPHQIVALLRSGEMHPAHNIKDYRGVWNPLYMIAAWRRDLNICKLMLQYAVVDPKVATELVYYLSEYHQYYPEDVITDLFKQLISITNLDIEANMNGADWLEEVVQISWLKFIYYRLQQSYVLYPIDKLLALDPCTITHHNLNWLITVYGINIGTIHCLEQSQKDWLLHAFLAQTTERRRNLPMVRSLLIKGADPYSVVKGRSALATIFVKTDLDTHLHVNGCNVSIFQAWLDLMKELGFDQEMCYKQKIPTRDCRNTLKGHDLQLRSITSKDVFIKVSFKLHLYTKESPSGVACWSFRQRGSAWECSTRIISSSKAKSLRTVIEDLGYGDMRPTRPDDTCWITQQLQRDHPREQLRRSHSQPRSLQGLRWIPAPTPSCLYNWLICPFTGILHERPQQSLIGQPVDFLRELGICLDLYDHRPGPQIWTSTDVRPGLPVQTVEVPTWRPRPDDHPLIKTWASGLWSEAHFRQRKKSGHFVLDPHKLEPTATDLESSRPSLPSRR